MALFDIEEDLLFKLCSNLALIGWVFIIALPRYHHTKNVATIIALIQALVYSALFINGYSEGNVEMDNFRSLDGVYRLFSVRSVMLAGWVHYLSFDMWVGLWILQDSQSRLIAHQWIIPALVLTFLAGPLGLFSYMSLRTLYGATSQSNVETSRRRHRSE